MKRCSNCGARLDWLLSLSPYFQHSCPSPKRGWWWCACCKAFRYANPSALDDGDPSCGRCGTPMETGRAVA